MFDLSHDELRILRSRITVLFITNVFLKYKLKCTIVLKIIFGSSQMVVLNNFHLVACKIRTNGTLTCNTALYYLKSITLQYILFCSYTQRLTRVFV